MRAGPLILHRSHGDAPRKFAYKIFWHLLHGYLVVLPHLLVLSFHLLSAIFLTFLRVLLLLLLLFFPVPRRHRDPLMRRSHSLLVPSHPSYLDSRRSLVPPIALKVAQNFARRSVKLREALTDRILHAEQ